MQVAVESPTVPRIEPELPEPVGADPSGQPLSILFLVVQLTEMGSGERMLLAAAHLGELVDEKED